MRGRIARETARERRELAADAGFGGFSFTSVLAGVLVAYGAFAILVALGAAVVGAVGADTDLSTDWETLGTAGGLVVAGLLFLAYLFGGYVAGRMARRNGLAHGLGVLVLGVVVVGAVAALARTSTGTDTIVDNLRSLGMPTTLDEYGQAGTVAGIASLVALIAGGLLGGALGERWHARLFARAADPTVGAQAAAAREAEDARTRANQTLARSEGRVRAHELERDRERTMEQERVLDDERDHRATLVDGPDGRDRDADGDPDADPRAELDEQLAEERRPAGRGDGDTVAGGDRNGHRLIRRR